MKKFMLLLFAMSIFYSTYTYADMICVKKRVAIKNKITLSKKFKIIKGSNCPKGFVKLVNTDSFKGNQGPAGPQGPKGDSFFEDGYLPSDTTFTGIVLGRDGKTSYVSFPAPSKYDFQIGRSEDCTGNPDNPTAPSGKVCIYKVMGYPKGSRIVIPFYMNNKDDAVQCDKIGGEYREAHCELLSEYSQGGDTPEKCEQTLGIWLYEPYCTNANYTDKESCLDNGWQWILGTCRKKENLGIVYEHITNEEVCRAPAGYWHYDECHSNDNKANRLSNRGFKVKDMFPKYDYVSLGDLNFSRSNGDFIAVWAFHTQVEE